MKISMEIKQIKELIPLYKKEFPQKKHVEIGNHIAKLCGFAQLNKMVENSKKHNGFVSIDVSNFEIPNKILEKLGNYLIVDSKYSEEHYGVVVRTSIGIFIARYRKESLSSSFDLLSNNSVGQSTLTQDVITMSDVYDTLN